MGYQGSSTESEHQSPRATEITTLNLNCSPALNAKGIVKFASKLYYPFAEYLATALGCGEMHSEHLTHVLLTDGFHQHCLAAGGLC